MEASLFAPVTGHAVVQSPDTSCTRRLALLALTVDQRHAVGALELTLILVQHGKAFGVVRMARSAMRGLIFTGEARGLALTADIAIVYELRSLTLGLAELVRIMVEREIVGT